MISVKCPACGLVDRNVGNCKRCETPLTGLRAEDDEGYLPGLSEAAAEARAVSNARIVVTVCLLFVLGLTTLGVLYVARKPSKPQWFRSSYRNEPTVAEVFAHNLEVSGGAERIANLRSFRAEGRLTFNGGAAARVAAVAKGEVTVVMHVKEPDKTEMEVELGTENRSDSPFAPPAPKVTATLRRGFDGKRGWEYIERAILTPGSTVPVKQHSSRELSGDELERMKHSSHTTGLLRLAEQYTSLRLTGRQAVNWVAQSGTPSASEKPVDDYLFGHEAYVVSGMNREGKEEKLYFDTETGLLLRVDFEAENEEGETVKVECAFGDYKRVDGIKLPHRLHFKQGEESSIIIFKNYFPNDPVPDSTFEMPE